MSRRRLRYLLILVLTLIVFALSVPLALAVNAASDAAQWGWLDLIRRHPFWSVAVLAVLSLFIIAVTIVRQNTGPEPASADDLLGAEGRLHRRFDEADLGRTTTDDRMDRLPPYARMLINTADGAERAAIWRVVSPFTDEGVDPRSLAQEWAASPPVVIEDLPVAGRLAVAEILAAYDQAAAGVEQLRAAAGIGATPRAYWLVRMAQLTWKVQGEASTQAVEFLEEAQGLHPDYPLLRAVVLSRSAAWSSAEEALRGWTPPTPWERDTALMVLVGALVQQDRMDEAITVLGAGTEETHHAGLLLQLARMLRARSFQGTGDSRWKDAFRSIDVALRARNLRRSWRGDSAEAVVVAAEAAIGADDHQQVWSITRPPPDGEATGGEAADVRVLPVAAMGAALTGRVTQAQELVAHAPEGYVRKRVEAEIASTLAGDGGDSAVSALWMEVYRSSPDDEERLYALRALAMEGATDQEALSDLRARYPQVVADIETILEVMSVAGTDIDERLRALEPRTPLASLRRAELLRTDDPQLAANVLADATARWNDPRLLLLAVDCYVDAGDWSRAEHLTQQAITDSGTLWPGRATLLRRMVSIQWALKNWSKMAAACRGLLEIDHLDDDARWNLAFAQYREGDTQVAWQTLNRAGVAVEASTSNRACFLLDLVRRFADAARVAKTAVAMLRAFPEDRDVHAAAIHAVTLRADRTDLPNEIGQQVTAAWSSFFERYSDTGGFTRYTIRTDDNPLAEIEPQLRQHASTYHEVLGAVQDQVLPAGLLERVVGKPYSALFLYRPLGFHRAASSAERDVAIEVEMARSASASVCFIDASALYTLALIPEFAQTLVSLTQRPTITDAALQDLVAADDMFSTPADGTVAFDPALGRIVVTEPEPDVVQRQQAQIRTMLTTARSLRRVIHPALVHLSPLNGRREPIWLLSLDAAKDSNGAIWADDLGVRRLAHSLGVATFGTCSLLSLAHERQRIDDTQLSRITRALIREYVVDLPFDRAALLSVAAEQNWKPRSVATVLSRPASWVNAKPTIDLFRATFRKAPRETLTAWAHAALYGLKQASPPTHRHNNLVGFTTAILSEEWTRPEHSSGILRALKEVSGNDGDDLGRAALDRVWQRMREAYSIEEAVTVFLHVISQLEESQRQYGVHLILQTE